MSRATNQPRGLILQCSISTHKGSSIIPPSVSPKRMWEGEEEEEMLVPWKPPSAAFDYLRSTSPKAVLLCVTIWGALLFGLIPLLIGFTRPIPPSSHPHPNTHPSNFRSQNGYSHHLSPDEDGFGHRLAAALQGELDTEEMAYLAREMDQIILIATEVKFNTNSSLSPGAITTAYWRGITGMSPPRFPAGDQSESTTDVVRSDEEASLRDMLKKLGWPPNNEVTLEEWVEGVRTAARNRLSSVGKASPKSQLPIAHHVCWIFSQSKNHLDWEFRPFISFPFSQSSTLFQEQSIRALEDKAVECLQTLGVDAVRHRLVLASSRASTPLRECCETSLFVQPVPAVRSPPSPCCFSLPSSQPIYRKSLRILFFLCCDFFVDFFIGPNV